MSLGKVYNKFRMSKYKKETQTISFNVAVNIITFSKTVIKSFHQNSGTTIGSNRST